jgi:hypothetical protein
VTRTAELINQTQKPRLPIRKFIRANGPVKPSVSKAQKRPPSGSLARHVCSLPSQSLAHVSCHATERPGEHLAAGLSAFAHLLRRAMRDSVGKRQTSNMTPVGLPWSGLCAAASHTCGAAFRCGSVPKIGSKDDGLPPKAADFRR